ncbi:MAG: hypothetical protein BWY20_00218 [Spirochaetes bacterium ADurb.Bin215]|nr:MAG: hypothetical protein BWY20_00218 [Spirochaetes bacterium ADurb.Bin215]
MINIGFVHSPEELTGIGGQGFYIPALTLGENGIEGEGTLSRAR